MTTRRVLDIVLWLTAVGTICYYWLNPFRNPGAMEDFGNYYQSASLFQQGLSPHTEDMGAYNLDGKLYKKEFTYIPLTRFVAYPFTAIEYDTAARIFNVLKLLAVIGLIALWRKFLPESVSLPLMVLCAMLWFGRPIAIDTVRGNISVFEQLAIWFGLYCFIRERYTGFVIAILLAALFKGVPVLLLGLLVLNRRYKEFAIGVLLFAVYLLLNYVSDPELFRTFLASANVLDERGAINPSSLAFFRDLTGQGDTASPGVMLHLTIAEFLYAAFAISVFIISWLAHRAYPQKNMMNAITVWLFAFALGVPRFKDYSFILLLLPSFLIVLRMQSWYSRILWSLLLLLPLAADKLAHMQTSVPSVLTGYTSFALALGCWVWSIVLNRRDSQEIIGSTV